MFPTNNQQITATSPGWVSFPHKLQPVIRPPRIIACFQNSPETICHMVIQSKLRYCYSFAVKAA